MGDAWAAVDIGDPMLMGAALHEVQDWYSHWNEGYRIPLGHAKHSALASLPWRAEQFFEEHPLEAVTSALAGFYGTSQIAGIPESDLVDLYLRTFTVPGSPERDRWGYNTDLYFEFTSRDVRMRIETRGWLQSYYWELDDCELVSIISDYQEPDELDFWRFLLTRSYER